MIKIIKKFKRVNQHKLKTKKTCRKNKQTLKKHIGGAVRPGITTICSRIAHSVKNAFMSCMPSRRQTSNISLGSIKPKPSFEDTITEMFEYLNNEYIKNTTKLLEQNIDIIQKLFIEIPINLQKILTLLQEQSKTIYTNQETFFNTQLNTIKTVFNSFNVNEREDKDLYNKIINIYKKALILEHNNKRLYLYEYLHKNTIYYIAQYISIYNNNNNNNNNTTRKTHIYEINKYINTLNTDFNTQIEQITKDNNTKLNEYNATCMPDAAIQISNANKQNTINNLFPNVPTSNKNTKNTSKNHNNGDIYKTMFNNYNLTILRKSLPVVPTEEAMQQHRNDEFERIKQKFNELTNNKYV